MASMLSSVGVLLRFIEHMSEDGFGKGAVNALHDDKIKLISADGSMFKVIDRYLVEPVAVISNDLKDLDELDSILGLHLDMFTGYYMQIFDILRTQYEQNVNVIVDTLSTDKGGLFRAASDGLLSVAELANESEDMTDYLSELLLIDQKFSTESYQESVDNEVGKRTGAGQHIHHSEYDDYTESKSNDSRYAEVGKRSGEDDHYIDRLGTDREKFANAGKGDEAYAIKVGQVDGANAAEHDELNNPEHVKAKLKSAADTAYATQGSRNRADSDYARKNRKDLKDVKLKDRIYYANKDIEITPTGLSEATKDLLIPNAIQRSIQVVGEVTLEQPGSDGRYYTKKITIPITIKLAVLFTSKENIVNVIEADGDDSRFTNRLDSLMAGSLSVYEFMFASDLIGKYKKHKMKDGDKLLEIIKRRQLSSNSKLISNGYSGFEKYYNMFIISADVRRAVEKSLRRKLSNNKGKENFLEYGGGLSVTTLDTDYERMELMIKDVQGKTSLSFKNAVKREKGTSDYSDIIKALMVNKPPTF